MQLGASGLELRRNVVELIFGLSRRFRRPLGYAAFPGCSTPAVGLGGLLTIVRDVRGMLRARASGKVGGVALQRAHRVLRGEAAVRQAAHTLELLVEQSTAQLAYRYELALAAGDLPLAKARGLALALIACWARSAPSPALNCACWLWVASSAVRRSSPLWPAKEVRPLNGRPCLLPPTSSRARCACTRDQSAPGAI